MLESVDGELDEATVTGVVDVVVLMVVVSVAAVLTERVV